MPDPLPLTTPVEKLPHTATKRWHHRRPHSRVREHEDLETIHNFSSHGCVHARLAPFKRALSPATLRCAPTKNRGRANGETSVERCHPPSVRSAPAYDAFATRRCTSGESKPYG